MSLDGEGAPVTASVDQPDAGAYSENSKKKGAPRRSGAWGYVIKLGPKSYAIRWREGTRQLQNSGFTTHTAAADALAEKRIAVKSGEVTIRRKAKITFDEAAQKWLELHSKVKLRSHADNVARYERHVKPVLGSVPLPALTHERILELRAKLQAKVTKRRGRRKDGQVGEIKGKLAGRTINLVMALVRTILNFAVKNKLGGIKASPLAGIGRGDLMMPITVEQIDPPIGRPEDVWRVLEAIRQIGEERQRPSLYPFFATLVYTGLRRGEAIGLRWDNVHFETRLLKVKRSYVGQTKSNRHRTVTMPSELVTILKAYKLADPWKAELCFPNDAGQMYTAHAKLHAVLHEALRRVGLPRIRIHDLRHTYASHYLMNGGDLFTLQKALGHSSTQLISDVYGHLSPSHLAAEADRLSFAKPAKAGTVLPFEKKSEQRADSAFENSDTEAAGGNPQ